MQVKKSLYKFLNKGMTNTFITYNSNYSDIKEIKSLYSEQTLNPLNTSDTALTGTITSITVKDVVGNGTLFTTEVAIGDTIKVNDALKVIESITDDTNLVLVEDFTYSWNIGDSIYKPSGKEFVALQEIAGLVEKLDTDIDLSGWSVYVNGEKVKIASYDSTKSQVLLSENTTIEVMAYDEDLLTGSDIEISNDHWLFMKKVSINNVESTRRYNYGQLDRWNLFIKTKDDSDKNKMDVLVQDLKDLIFKNMRFPVYDTDMLTILCYAEVKSWRAEEIVDNNNDLQSYLVSLQIQYYMDYING